MGPRRVPRGADPRVRYLGDRENALEYARKEDKVKEEYVKVLEEAVKRLEGEERAELGLGKQEGGVGLEVEDA
jgi:hypothetical protein